MTDEVFIIAAYGMLVILSILAIVTIGNHWLDSGGLHYRPSSNVLAINPGAIRNIT
jgi:hypothetical protein